MFERNAENAISMIFEMPCIEYSGQEKRGGEVYLYWDDIDVAITNETEKVTTAIASISFVSLDNRDGIGFLSSKLFQFNSKPESIKIEALDHKESKIHIGKSKFECFKRIRITEKVKFNNTRETIKNVNLEEV